MSDLIAAIATGSIATAIGIVRVSGDGCFAACDRVFRPRNGVPFAQQPSHKMVFGEMLDGSGAVIDQGLAVRFGGGHSYTGEDSAEFHCHGSPVVLHTLLPALFAAGARQAQAGEFTKRPVGLPRKTPQPNWTAVSAAAWSRCRRPSSTSPPGFTPW